MDVKLGSLLFLFFPEIHPEVSKGTDNNPVLEASGRMEMGFFWMSEGHKPVLFGFH